jgi:hypothetical protein
VLGAGVGSVGLASLALAAGRVPSVTANGCDLPLRMIVNVMVVPAGRLATAS